jgi:hypothetical protein
LKLNKLTNNNNNNNNNNNKILLLFTGYWLIISTITHKKNNILILIANKEINVAVIILQVQFTLMFIHSSQIFFIDCEFSKVFACVTCSYALVFFILFADYYKRAYKKEQKIKVRTRILYYKLTLLCCFVCLLHCSVAQIAVHTVPCYCGYPVLVGIATHTG